MKWSYSKSKIFNQCQRKWFFIEFMASHGKKDSLRREVFLLKQLQSIYAWRGSLVDKVIEKKIIPLLNYSTPVKSKEEEIKVYAKNLIEAQLKFGINRRHTEKGMTKSHAEDIYCAFYDLEYFGKLDNEKIETAKKEIFSSLKNLINSDLIQQLQKDNNYSITQRALNFTLDNFNITATPDVIVFYADRPPKIIDWKVRTVNSDAWLQLGTYALALNKVTPHVDFPDNANEYLKKPEEFTLIEYQLLSNIQKIHRVDYNDLNDIEDKIFLSIKKMMRLTDGKTYNNLDISDFKTAYYPELCASCQFKKICWRENLNGQYTLKFI